MSEQHVPHEQPAVFRPEPSVPVVKVLSVRGVEYGLMTFMVWIGAASLVWCLLALVNGSAGFDTLAFPVSLLLVAVPVFSFLFLRLRKAEMMNPALRFEPSKRRFSQLTQFLSFFVCFSNVVGLIYTMLSSTTNDSYSSIGKTALNTLIVVAVAGGIFAYYWLDEHRPVRH